MSEVINGIRHDFKVLNHGTEKNPYLFSSVSFADFAAHVKSSGSSFSDEEVSELFKLIDADHSGAIDYIDWLDFVEPLRVRVACAPVARPSPLLVC